MTNYWIAVASKEHVEKGVAGGFAQVCHGKGGPLKAMKSGDWIAYYSPTFKFQIKESCQSFTAIGTVLEKEPYTYMMSPDFIPWRRDVTFLKSQNASILPLIAHLNFIIEKKRWGFPFKRGCFKISKADFVYIAHAMGIFLNE